MTVQISGFFPALIIGEASVAAGHALQRLASPCLQKYPKYLEIERVVVNLAGSIAAACLLSTVASVPVAVAIAVSLIAQGVFYSLRYLEKTEDGFLTRKDLWNFLENLKKIPHMRDQFFTPKPAPPEQDKYELLDDSGSDSEPELVRE